MSLSRVATKRPSLIGLCGAHRTGKTTLARYCANNTPGITLVETSTSQVFKDLKRDPKADYPFAERLRIQDAILLAAEQIWASVEKQSITDRTPIDMLAYTMADISRANISKEEVALFLDYQTRCLAATNRYFSALRVVQPGIPLVDAPGKAPANLAYMEHLNTLMVGLCSSPRVFVPSRIIPRGVLNMDLRAEEVIKA